MQAIVLASNRSSGRIRPTRWLASRSIKPGRGRGSGRIKPTDSPTFFSTWTKFRSLLVALCSSLLLLSGCRQPQARPARVVNLQQTWELEPGDEVGGRVVTGGLGDVTIQLAGSKFHAPFDGEIEPAEQASCAIYSTPEVPAYLFRLCGLTGTRFGSVRAGQSLGSGDYLNFATLRRQPSGTWIIVEPSTGILERALSPGIRSALPDPVK